MDDFERLFYEWLLKEYKFNQRQRTKEEIKLINTRGKNIKICDERDERFIPVEHEWTPVPMMVTEKDIKKEHRKLEKYLFNSGFTINNDDDNNVGRPRSKNKRVYVNNIKKLKAAIELEKESQRFTRKMRLPIPEWVKEEVHARKGYMCESCYERRFDHYHHINEVPDDNRPENIALLCYPCHKMMHKK